MIPEADQVFGRQLSADEAAPRRSVGWALDVEVAQPPPALLPSASPVIARFDPQGSNTVESYLTMQGVVDLAKGPPPSTIAAYDLEDHDETPRGVESSRVSAAAWVASIDAPRSGLRTRAKV